MLLFSKRGSAVNGGGDSFKVNNNIADQVILDAALQVVAEKSISGTRLHLIAKKAGTAQSNLHYYYRTKHDLLVALFRNMQSGFEENRHKTMQKDYPRFEDRLQVFFDQKKKTILTNPAIDYAQIDYWSQCRSDDEIKEIFNDSYRVWRQEMMDAIGSFYPEIPEEERLLISYMMVSVLIGASLQYHNDPVLDLDAYFDMGKNMILEHVAVSLAKVRAREEDLSEAALV